MALPASQPNKLMNSHRVWKTPQDWRKRPEAEVKLPRDPTEAPDGSGTREVCETQFGWLFFFGNAKGDDCFGECVITKIWNAYVKCQLVGIEGIEGIDVFNHILSKQLERSECCWSMEKLIHHQDEMFYLQLGEQETLIRGSILWISLFVCQTQVKLTSVFKRKFNRGKK